MDERRSVTYPTPFGDGWIAFDATGLVATGLPGTKNPFEVTGKLPRFAAALGWELTLYWVGGGPLPSGDAVIPAGSRTDLDRAIYETISAIPPGQTMTYGEVAAQVGRPGAARAVGAAMAGNRFAPIIPCHRVVGSDGTLRGYGGGLEMKQYLLDLEAASVG